MPTWFYGAIAFQQTDDSVAVDTQKDGSPEAPKMKKVTEAYLFDAVSYTDAEARLYAWIADNTPDFEITALRPMRLSDVFQIDKEVGEGIDGETWYRCKTYYMTEDDKGRSKKVASAMLINAHNVQQAVERLTEKLSTMLVPVVITDVNTTPILDVVPYAAIDLPQPKPAQPEATPV
ncbi:hypothetical protein FAES_3924 [Fibrella aestuarina BUZ 2]|uniref:DUF4494 domain-containing protein n=1 Tax=Fibrella aestuarina BUZ 2 TaxID=1166018 RepID=I0KCS7_9BACT|nr:DUF4494 domain-containing protein [Fibrella aestuarina]CCH01930.1 hypothetical protein FAES_3924 [Fibrella aestuarina BUZ 2]